MSDQQRPYVDAQSMSADEMQVYETIANLEYLGRPASREQIIAVSELDEAAVDEALRALTGRQALSRAGDGDDTVYEPASRDWSALPGKPARERAPATGSLRPGQRPGKPG